ncbi:MAG: class I SAM-dependent methyltransferase [Coleofasciculaceae cyanobacterium]
MKFEEVQNWYQNFAANYTSQQRKDWYSGVADEYEQARPSYPQELINRAVEIAQLPKNARILELGCGPGKATTAFAENGFSMICLEPSQPASEIAKRNCAIYPQVEIKNTNFEEYLLENEQFHAVLAANAWHWMPPEIKYKKAAAILKDHGYLILLWNLTPQLPYEVYQAIDEQVYQIHAPDLALTKYENQETQEEILAAFGQNVLESGLFNNLVSEHIICERTYSSDEYLMLLHTFSNYGVLEPQQKEAVFNGIREVLSRNGASVPVSYLAAVQVAQKK